MWNWSKCYRMTLWSSIVAQTFVHRFCVCVRASRGFRNCGKERSETVCLSSLLFFVNFIFRCIATLNRINSNYNYNNNSSYSSTVCILMPQVTASTAVPHRSSQHKREPSTLGQLGQRKTVPNYSCSRSSIPWQQQTIENFFLLNRCLWRCQHCDLIDEYCMNWRLRFVYMVLARKL